MMPPYQNIEYWIVSVVPYSTSLSAAHADSGNAHPGAVIDNLTATIVCVKILKRVVPHKKAPLYHLYGQIGFNLKHFWRLVAHLSGLASFLWWPYSCGCQCWRWGREEGTNLKGAMCLGWVSKADNGRISTQVHGVPLVMSPLPCYGFVIRSLPQAGGVANYWNGLGNTTCKFAISEKTNSSLDELNPFFASTLFPFRWFFFWNLPLQGTITWLFFPSFVAGVLPLFGIWWQATRESLHHQLCGCLAVTLWLEAKRCAPAETEEEKREQGT